MSYQISNIGTCHLLVSIESNRVAFHANFGAMSLEIGTLYFDGPDNICTLKV